MSAIIHQFQQATGNERASILKDDSNVELLVQAVIEELQADSSESYKLVILLSVLEENAAILLHKADRMERVCAILNKIINSTASVYDFHAQVLSTLTTILIMLDVKEKQPLAFESFVELLFDIVSNVNSSTDRTLRGIACQCLQELEEIYPGLLSSGLGHFFSFAQKENTHVAMEYASLFVLVFQHHLMSLCPSFESHLGESKLQKVMSSGSSGSFLALFSVREPLCPFAIPTDMFTDPEVVWEKEKVIGEAFVTSSNPFETLLAELTSDNHPMDDLESLKLFGKDIKLAIQFLAGTAQRRMTKWTQSRVIFHLLSIIKTCTALNLDIFRLHFGSFIQSCDVFQLHTVAILMCSCWPQNTFTEEDLNDYFIRAVKQLSITEISTEDKYLLFNWIHSLSNTISYPSHHPKFKVNFCFPSIFDPPFVKEAKLISLAHRLATNSLPSADTTKLTPSDYIRGLKSLRDFKYHQAGSARTVSAFRVLHAFLSVPALFEDAAQYGAKILNANPSLVSDFGETLEYLRREKPDTKHKILERFNQWLVASSQGPLILPIPSEAAKLSHYLDLLLIIVSDQFIQISGLLSAITDVLKTSDLCLQGDWRLGNKLLKVVKCALSKHNTNLIFNTLTSLLLFIGVYYKNVDIRDRAHFYYMLLTHLPKDRMDLVLLSPVYLPPTQSEEADTSKPSVTKYHVDFPILLMEKLPKEEEVDEQEEEEEPLSIDSYSILRLHSEFIQRNSSRVRRRQAKPKSSSTTATSSPPGGEEAENSETNIKLNLLLHYDPKVVPKLDPSLVSLVGVNFKFSSSPMYDPIEPLDIPYIALPPMKATQEEKIAFPHAYRLSIVTSPVVPIPASFNVSMSFNDMQGSVHNNCPVSPLIVNFEDLLLPIPIPADFTTSKGTYLALLFEELWEFINEEKEDDMGYESYYGKREDGDDTCDFFTREKLFCTSVKFLEIKKAKMISAILKEMRQFLVNPELAKAHKRQTSAHEEELASERAKKNEDEAEAMLIHIFIFLPRSYHLLMKFKVEETQTLITIKTDYWRVLTYIDSYLEDILKR